MQIKIAKKYCLHYISLWGYEVPIKVSWDFLIEWGMCSTSQNIRKAFEQINKGQFFMSCSWYFIDRLMHNSLRISPSINARQWPSLMIRDEDEIQWCCAVTWYFFYLFSVLLCFYFTQVLWTTIFYSGSLHPLLLWAKFRQWFLYRMQVKCYYLYVRF